MKTHVITLSKNFLKGHKKHGQPTYFKQRLLDLHKIHTIRDNYPFWSKKITQVMQGGAELSIREWTEQPFRSPQEEIRKVRHSDKLGYQKIIKRNNGFEIGGKGFLFDEIELHLATNDGLSLDDFRDWFKDVENGTEMIIIHFTAFRYK